MKAGQETALLRKRALCLRDSMPDEMRAQKSGEIRRLLFQSDAYRRADSLLVYLSYKTEVSTAGLIDCALAQKKRVYVPKVEGERMRFYRIFADRDVMPGFRGIPEPAGNTAAWEAGMESSRAQTGEEGFLPADRYENRTLLLAPGTAFDRFGHRIGYGGGFYDRFLGGIPKQDRPYCIGLCFACQLVEYIEPKEHDIAMDMVLYA